MKCDVCEPDTISAARDGDADAFEALVKEYYSMVFHLAYKFSLNHHEAEDITQDVFLKLARAIRGFEGKSKFSTWMYRIVSSVYLDCQQKKK